MKQFYTTFNELPITLSAEQLAQVLNISRAGSYQLMHAKGFPTLKIGKRMVVPKEELRKWMDDKLAESDSLF